MVTGKPGGHEVQVRAGNRSHLGNLATLAGWNTTRILETLHADYRFRIIVTPGEWEEVASKLAVVAERVTNFKSAAQAELGRTDPEYVETFTTYGV